LVKFKKENQNKKFSYLAIICVEYIVSQAFNRLIQLKLKEFKNFFLNDNIRLKKIKIKNKERKMIAKRYFY
jgi:hypothetical protein